MKRAVFAFIAMLSFSACGSQSSPTVPSSTATVTATRIVNVTGNMDFGQIQVGQSFAATLHVTNSGNATLTFTGLTGSNNIISVIAASPTSGTIPPNGSVDIAIRFTPTAALTYTGTISVSTDQTAGTNSVAFTGTGTLNGLPVFSKSGSGDSVFDMPSWVTKVRITASYAGSSSNFIVWIGPPNVACDLTVNAGCRLLVNEIVGTFVGKPSYDATLLTGGGGTVAVVKSSGVAWTMTESR